jgi:hypothetical protein
MTNMKKCENAEMKPSLGLLLSQEKDRAWFFQREGIDIRSETKKSYISVTDDEFKALFASVSLKDIDTTIKVAKGEDRGHPNGFSAEDLPRSLESNFRKGMILCPIILPFDDSGHGKNVLGEKNYNEMVERGVLLRLLLVDPSDNLTFGYGGAPGYYYDFLPESIKKDTEEEGCAILLDYQYPENDYRNRVWFLAKFNQALMNFRKYLLKPI